MGNPYFNFKAFSVSQSRASMKVCTDSCLFGAWAAQRLSESFADVKKVLDIGTGTGLLSLMIAQQHGAEIHAIDIEADSLQDARLNFEHSPWKQRLFLQHALIQNFALEHEGTFDALICNPPFFHASLKSANEGKNISKHEGNLSLEELVKCIDLVLKNAGIAFILLPATRGEFFEKVLKEHNLSLAEKINVSKKTGQDPFRIIFCLTRKQEPEVKEHYLSIRDDQQSYTEEFIELLKPYYLNL